MMASAISRCPLPMKMCCARMPKGRASYRAAVSRWWFPKPFRIGIQRWRPMVGLILLLSVAIAGATDPGPPAAAFIQPVGAAQIDWTEAVVHATGIRAPEGHSGSSHARALAAAQQQARAELVNALMAVQVDARLNIGGVAEANKAMAAPLRDMVAAAPVVKQAFLSDGTAAVTVALPLSGGLSQLILPADVRQVQPIQPVGSSAATPPAGGAYSGLVVDARGIDLRPAMVLTIRDESGAEVFGPAFVSREFAVQWGVCRYVSDLDAARRWPRIGDRPMVVKALRSAGPNRTELIISHTDAASLLSASTHLVFLRTCRVVVVADPPEISGQAIKD